MAASIDPEIAKKDAAMHKNGTDPLSAPQAVGTPTVSHMLGELTWLLTQSPTHRHFALSDLEWMIMPPLLLEQYRVFRGDKDAPFDPEQSEEQIKAGPQTPLGYATWALLSEEAETKLNTGQSRLRPDEWRSGDRLWLVDLVAPFHNEGNKHVERMMTDLLQVMKPVLAKAKDGKLKFHQTDIKTGKRQVVELG